MGPLNVRARTILMLVGLVLLGVPGSSLAQESTPGPSPEELWNAYPLDPGDSSPTVEPLSPPAEATNATSSQSPSGSGDDGAFPTGVVVLVLTAAAFTAGLALGRGRRRGRAIKTEPVITPPPERRFAARVYPPPARPAPPPPPVPARGGQE
jgi:hypothetical protein